jgi:hypothetical protein
MRKLDLAEIDLVCGGMGSRGYVAPKTPAMEQCERGMIWGTIGGALAGATAGPISAAFGAAGGFLAGAGSAGCFAMRPRNVN